MRSLPKLPALALAVGLSFSVVSVVSADTEHRVREGQTLSEIAHRYHVSARVIARANRLGNGARLRVGQILVIPTGPTITVGRGETLQSLARRHSVTVADLARTNGLSERSRIRPGQELIVPEGAGGSGSSRDAGQWGRARNPGIVSFQRLGSRDAYRGRLVDTRGRAREDARRRLSRLMRDDDGSVRLPNPRLLAVLVRISDHFGGRKIHIVSGYRRAGGYTRDTSRHTHGDAMDLRIEGVPITAIRDYCRSLQNTGCGYYPRSRFVHVDVRDRSTYWVDWSGPGEAPQYRRPAGATDADGDGTDSDGEQAAESEGAESSATPSAPEPAAPSTP